MSAVYGDPEQFAILLDHIARQVDNEPDASFANGKIHGSALTLYRHLGRRLGEPDVPEKL